MSFDKNRLVQDGEEVKLENEIDNDNLVSGPLAFGVGFDNKARAIKLSRINNRVQIADNEQIVLLQAILEELQNLNVLIKEIVEGN